MQLRGEVTHRTAKKVNLNLTVIGLVPDPLEVFRTFDWLIMQLLDLPLKRSDCLNTNKHFHSDE